MLGVIIGDIAGSIYKFDNTYDYHCKLLSKVCYFTDESVCSIAVADAIIKRKMGLPTDYEHSLRKWCNKYHNAGYGGGFARWLDSDNPQPYNSWGNGSAMRVSAVGWAFNTLEQTIAEAELSAACTHNHPEGLKGASVTAQAIYMLRKGGNKNTLKKLVIKNYGKQFVKQVPARGVFDVSCQGCVPLALFTVIQSSSFEDALRLAISYGGDSNTMRAITCSIAEALFGIPDKIIRKVLKYLPDDMRQVLYTFENRYVRYLPYPELKIDEGAQFDLNDPSKMVETLESIKRKCKDKETRRKVMDELNYTIYQYANQWCIEEQVGKNENGNTEARALLYKFGDTLVFFFRDKYGKMAANAWKKALGLAAEKGITENDIDNAIGKRAGKNTIAYYEEKIKKYEQKQEAS